MSEELDSIEYQEALKTLVNESLSILKFSEAVKSAKMNSAQSNIYHAVSVATLTTAIGEEISKSVEGSEGILVLKKIYKTDYRRLCYYSGFFHDWVKFYSETSGSVPADARQKAKELAKQSKIPDSDVLIDYIADFAEGHLPNNIEAPLWVSVKIADMLMISDIYSISDVFRFARKLNYQEAVRILNGYNLYLSYIKTSPRLFTLLISDDLLKEIEGKPLISYKDGIVYLSRGKKTVSLSKIYRIYNEKLHSAENKDSNIEEIKRCLNGKREEWEALNLGKYKEVLYDKDGKAKTYQSFLPSKTCKPFEDIVNRLKTSDKFEVAKRVIEDLRDDIPYAVITYFIEKFSREDENYVRNYLGIKEKFPAYLEQINAKAFLSKIIQALQERYTPQSTLTSQDDLTLKAFVKKSFNGDVSDDLPSVNEKPKNYCVVCGTPIYDSPVSFVRYGSLVGGKSEIWIPRETGLKKVDNIRKYWAICPFCSYEAEQMNGNFKPPYIIISFYPGVPVDLLSLLRFDYSKIEPYYVYMNVKNDKSFLDVYIKSGGHAEPKEIDLSHEVKPDYFGAKAVIPLQRIMPTEKKLSTRLTKNELNHLLYYAPFVSISYLASPLFISSNIYDFPLTTKNFEVFSDIKYTWLRSETDNYTKMLLLLAYSAKYKALKDMFGRNDDMENNLNSMANDMDLFSSVDISLGILATGMAVEEKRFFGKVKFFVPFLNFALKKINPQVSPMGEILSESVDSLAEILKETTKGNESKHDIVGFLRDGIEMFFKSTVLDKEDRINISASAALNTLSLKYNLNETQTKIAFSKLRDIFSELYGVEEKSDRSLAISISTSLVNWLYILYLYKRSGEEDE